MNYTNSNGYAYGYVEVQTCVEIIVDLGEYTSDPNVAKFNEGRRYLMIEPCEKVKAKYVYGTNTAPATGGTNTQNRARNISNFRSGFSSYKEINAYNLLTNLRETKAVINDGKDYMIYQYYFLGEVIKSKETELVETVKFTLVKDKNF
ncbi:MAG: hypothetical protein IJ867_03290 [Clostridia bacterium]|nr:hypothetical protein [Clostridia bacterium]